jgi:hypothetical protein
MTICQVAPIGLDVWGRLLVLMGSAVTQSSRGALSNHGGQIADDGSGVDKDILAQFPAKPQLFVAVKE